MMDKFLFGIRMIVITLLLLLSAENTMQADWQKLGGPFGGSISGLAVIENNLFASTFGGEVYSLTQGDTVWKLLTQIPFKESIVDIYAIKQRLYLIFEEPSLLYSDDLGQTWQTEMSPLNLNLQQTCFAQNGTTLYLGGNQGVYASYDWGQSWESYPDLDSVFIYDMLFHNSKFYLATRHGILVSADGGTTWNPCNSGLNADLIFSLMSVGNNLYAVGENSCIAWSNNGGNSWTILNNGLPYPNCNLEFIATDGTQLFVGIHFEGLYRSTNMGVNWLPVNTGIQKIKDFEYPFLNEIAHIGTTHYIATSSGMYFSTNNCVNWAPINSGLTANTITGFTQFNDLLLMATPDMGVFAYNKSTNEFNHYSQLPIPTLNIQSLGTMDSIMYIGTNLYGLYLSTDMGNTWDHGGGIGQNTPKITDILTVDTVLYITHNYTNLYRSLDKGLTWSSIDNGLAEDQTKTLINIGKTLFCGVMTEGVFRSDDQGTTWTTVNQGLDNFNIRSLAENGSYLFAGTMLHGIYRSEDMGQQWIQIAPSLYGTSITLLKYAGSNLYAYSHIDRMVMYSSDNGLTWKSSGYLTPFQHVNRLECDKENLYLGCYFGPLWSRPLLEMEECIEISLPTLQYGTAYQPVEIPVIVPDLTGKNIKSFYFVVNVDPDILSFDGIVKSGSLASDFEVTASSPAQGQLEVTGSGTVPLSDSGNLIYLRFIPSDLDHGQSILTFTNPRFNDGIPCITPIDGLFKIFTCQTGDITGDGRVSAYDASKVLRHVAGLETLPDYQQGCAEVNCNTTINAQDAAVILFYTAGRIPSLPFCGLLPSQSLNKNISPYQSDSSTTLNLKTYYESLSNTLHIPVILNHNSHLCLTSFQFDLHYDSDRMEFIQASLPARIQNQLVSVINSSTSGLIRIAAAASAPLVGIDTLIVISFSPRPGLSFIPSPTLENTSMNGDSIAYFTAGDTNNHPILLAESVTRQTPDSALFLTLYPNPFNQQTLITYRLPNSSPVCVAIYDVTGKIRHQWNYSMQSAGLYHLDLNAKDLSSGLYFISLQAAGNQVIRKIIIVR